MKRIAAALGLAVLAASSASAVPQRVIHLARDRDFDDRFWMWAPHGEGTVPRYGYLAPSLVGMFYATPYHDPSPLGRGFTLTDDAYALRAPRYQSAQAPASHDHATSLRLPEGSDIEFHIYTCADCQSVCDARRCPEEPANDCEAADLTHDGVVGVSDFAAVARLSAIVRQRSGWRAGDVCEPLP